MSRNNKFILLCSVLTFGFLFLCSCSSESGEDPVGGIGGTGYTEPDIPPEESFTIDTSTIEEDSFVVNEKRSLQNSFEKVKKPGLHFEKVNAIHKKIEDRILSRLSMPNEFLQAALNADAEKNESDRYKWTYQINKNAVLYEVSLYATYQEDEIYWEMYISFENMIDHLFFTGNTNLDITEGLWKVFDIRKVDELLYTIDWKASSEGIQFYFKDIQKEDSSEIDSLRFTQIGGESQIDFYDFELEEVTVVKWRPDDRSGSILAPDFNNGDESPWGTEGQDLDRIPRGAFKEAVLPPKETVLFDMSFFDDIFDLNGDGFENILLAREKIAFIKDVFQDQIASPFQALSQGRTVEAVLEDDGWFHKRFEIDGNEFNYLVDLSTIRESNRHKWNLMVTDLNLSEVDQVKNKWMDGVVQGIELSEGYSNLYNLENGNRIQTIDWFRKKEPSDLDQLNGQAELGPDRPGEVGFQNHFDLTIIIVDQLSPFFGMTLHYIPKIDQDFAVFFRLNEDLVKIEWNEAKNTGFLYDSVLGDTFHWDQYFMNLEIE